MSDTNETQSSTNERIIYNVISDEWLDCVTSSKVVKRGVIHAKKCDILVEIGQFESNLIVKEMPENKDSVAYEFQTTKPVARAIIDFMADHYEEVEEYDVEYGSQKWTVRKEGDKVTATTLDNVSSNLPKWIQA